MSDYKKIYRERAEEYDRLVSAEDCEGNLLPAIEAVATLKGATLLDIGTGTGRVARLLLPHVAEVIGVEPSSAMIAVAERHLKRSGLTHWELVGGSADALPVASGRADVSIAAWVYGHLRSWQSDRWRDAIGECLDEMERCTRVGGSMIVIETMGTAVTTPAPPSPELAEYYAWLEAQRGFSRAVISTDYRFDDVATAVEVCGAFFGESLAKRVTAATVPEFTAVWSRRR